MATSRWNRPGKGNCTNYDFWCDKLQKNCSACDDYSEAEDKYPYHEYVNRWALDSKANI